MGNPEETGKWQWGDEIEYSPEQGEGMKIMLEFLIRGSNYYSLDDMDNDRQGWSKEDLEQELDKLTNRRGIWKNVQG